MIPGNIEPGYFVHAAADNFDIGSESLDRKGLHCSNIVLCQPKPDDLQGQFGSVQTLSNKERPRALKLSEEQLNEAKVMDCPNLSLKCPGPLHMIRRVAMQSFYRESPENLGMKAITHAWLMSRICPIKLFTVAGVSKSRRQCTWLECLLLGSFRQR